ncbi:hypothetical protein ElyMa_000223600 [Elysia marginata]|uniref:ShKT domain-containing protein n=1 Tax=Elysia marginata TaxID=1093978 RepID=A0AAV4EYY0_9GAST|nr:hypothetical protein ElyMa_000223600 [Elysia marginata]
MASELKDYDNCYGEKPFFCAHNFMCYGFDEYCSKLEDRIQPCLPAADTLPWCKANLGNVSALPNPQCKWACSSRFNATELNSFVEPPVKEIVTNIVNRGAEERLLQEAEQGDSEETALISDTQGSSETQTASLGMGFMPRTGASDGEQGGNTGEGPESPMSDSTFSSSSGEDSGYGRSPNTDGAQGTPAHGQTGSAVPDGVIQAKMPDQLPATEVPSAVVASGARHVGHSIE